MVALATSRVAAARGAQRPHRALSYALPSLVIGIVIWGELYVWTEFAMHWYLMGGSAIVLGVLLGLPCRRLGALFDRRWALLLGALGFTMAMLGDLVALTMLAAERAGLGWLEFVGRLGVSEIAEWLMLRAPLDWLVAAAKRPSGLERRAKRPSAPEPAAKRPSARRTASTARSCEYAHTETLSLRRSMRVSFDVRPRAGEDTELAHQGEAP